MLADALRDPLTSVLNRRGFEKEGNALVRAYESGAVLYLDLNQFKSINDRFGHQAGDALLKAFGHRLEFCLRPEDILGRLGGDEFAIVLPGISVEDARQLRPDRIEDGCDRQHIVAEAHGLGLFGRVLLTHRAGVLERHHDGAHVVGAERVAGDRRGQR